MNSIDLIDYASRYVQFAVEVDLLWALKCPIVIIAVAVAVAGRRSKWVWAGVCSGSIFFSNFPHLQNCSISPLLLWRSQSGQHYLLPVPKCFSLPLLKPDSCSLSRFKSIKSTWECLSLVFKTQSQFKSSFHGVFLSLFLLEHEESALTGAIKMAIKTKTRYHDLQSNRPNRSDVGRSDLSAIIIITW